MTRPVNGTGGRAVHTFVTTHADYLGDPEADVHSFGQNDDFNMGNISSGENEGFLSNGTAAEDLNFWLGLNPNPNANTCDVNAPPGDDPNATLLSGDDDTFSGLANGVADDTFYNPLGVNSNAAAQAVTNEGSNASVDFNLPPGVSAPGASRSQDVNFR